MSSHEHVPAGHTGGFRATGGAGVSPGRQSAPPGQHDRQIPFYCPYCGEEDLRPAGPDGGSWRCGSCARAFQLRFAGVAP